MAQPRVRFAPSPTGELHIGGARTALFNLLYARGREGTLVLRIDDTDLERSRTVYVEALLETLRWLGLTWDEGPYFQSQRLELYQSEAEKLLAKGAAYRCYCSVEELAAGREEARRQKKAYLYPGTCRYLKAEEREARRAENKASVIRLAVPGSGDTIVMDQVKGEVRFANASLDDFIILKSNNVPTYNFASAVDDADLKITKVIRAEEHLSNTPRQLLCARALEYEAPVYAHVPMILAPDRSKLSKRHGATAVEEFREQGYLPEALVNYMALLGWSPGEDEEILPLEELVQRFDLDRVSGAAAIYDLAKLTWMNGYYLRAAEPRFLAGKALDFFAAEGLLETPLDRDGELYLEKVVALLQERANTLAELARAADYFYRDDFNYDEKGMRKQFQKDDTAQILRSAARALSTLEPLLAGEAEAVFHDLCNQLEISLGRLVQPVRLALTGRTGGPGLFEIMELLGRDRILSRLEKAACYIEDSRG